MPAQPAVLAQLCTSKMHNEILAAYRIQVPSNTSYSGPLNQKDPQYFVQWADAIGQGIAIGTPTVQFTTADAGFAGLPPVPGIGAGVGIIIDPKFFEQRAYSIIRDSIIANFGKTSHDPYPPTAMNSGVYLQAMTKAIGQSIAEHYKTAWVLTSAHPLIYQGTGIINNGKFFGIDQDLVTQSIQSKGTLLKGKAWPLICQGIAQAYKETIELHSTGQVAISGICVPAPPAQVCAIAPSVGAGTGTAA